MRRGAASLLYRRTAGPADVERSRRGPTMAPPGSPRIGVEGGAVRCSGSWTVDRIGRVERALSDLTLPTGVEVVVDASGVDAMDTAGAWLLHRIARALERSGRTVTLRLRPAHQGLLGIVTSSEVVPAAPAASGGVGVLEAVGRKAWTSAGEVHDLLGFVGETAVTAMRALAGPLRVRGLQVLQNVQSAGFEALPTAALLSLSIGIVIARQGSSLFRPFGAGILVADLVGLAMLRELSPLLMAIVAAARSGSAYAAQIGATCRSPGSTSCAPKGPSREPPPASFRTCSIS
ncbi:MAG TPA: ABC transporter permease [Anaeromyxobacteraceae bacterium]|nr:ABC transporter permease [Anaeromyxobacteraceae bacterium]